MRICTNTQAFGAPINAIIIPSNTTDKCPAVSSVPRASLAPIVLAVSLSLYVHMTRTLEGKLAVGRAFRVRPRRGQRVPDGPAAKTVSKEGPYPHLNLSGIQDALLQLESASSSTEFRGDELSPFSNDPFALASLPGDVLGNQQEFVGHVRNWLPFRLDGNGKYDNAAHQLAFGGGGGGPESSFQPRTGNISQPLSREEWMTDTARLVSAVQTSIHPAPSLQKMDQEFSHLPMVPTKLNKELVRTHLRLLSRFKASISGIPNPENPFMKHWIPYIIQDPLLINTVLFTSACFLNETGHLPKSVVVLLRGMVFQSLNNTLRSRESQTSDSAILAVAEMILDEWYWATIFACLSPMRCSLPYTVVLDLNSPITSWFHSN
ncbi:Berberine and berberine like [Geosmithia morbida]|uniref:Berberine and berberine like n=1 Tax=Geosmithia morbida TaxID=1094350 RepID=A0A9P5D364_9HYPO|nr:Berberine and berberine like [Geosmithia morbida]KAF4121490.1 Berberine and berberine like [Geosmithia morbida]